MIGLPKLGILGTIRFSYFSIANGREVNAMIGLLLISNQPRTIDCQKRKKESALLGLFLLVISLTLEAQDRKVETSSIFFAWTGKNDAQSEIIRGVTPADPAKWNSIFLSEENGTWCTAFAVGPRTIMTAAHCVPKDKTIVLKRSNDESIKASCSVPEAFQTDPTADYALCFLKTDISTGPYETINTEKNRLKKFDTIILTGFGCRQFSNRNQKEFSIGEVKFISAPGKNAGFVAGSASVCFGDSGGPAFVASSDDIANRVLIGINSKFTITEEGTMLSILALLPSNIQTFFEDSSAAGWTICGITKNAKKCRYE